MKDSQEVMTQISAKIISFVFNELRLVQAPITQLLNEAQYMLICFANFPDIYDASITLGSTPTFGFR